MNASASRCCSLTSNASSGWDACDCADQVERGPSSCSQPPPRTSESSPSSSHKQPTLPQQPNSQPSAPRGVKYPSRKTTESAFKLAPFSTESAINGPRNGVIDCGGILNRDSSTNRR